MQNINCFYATNYSQNYHIAYFYYENHLHIPSETEFKFITRKMLLNQFDYISEEVAEYIGEVTWKIKPCYLRLVSRIAILIKSEPTKEKVDQVIDNLNRYSVPESELRNLKVQI